MEHDIMVFGTQWDTKLYELKYDDAVFSQYVPYGENQDAIWKEMIRAKVAIHRKRKIPGYIGNCRYLRIEDGV